MVLIKELKVETGNPGVASTGSVTVAAYGSTNEIMMYRVPLVTGRPSW
jgi:hypothetical protein